MEAKTSCYVSTVSFELVNVDMPEGPFTLGRPFLRQSEGRHKAGKCSFILPSYGVTRYGFHAGSANPRTSPLHLDRFATLLTIRQRNSPGRGVLADAPDVLAHATSFVVLTGLRASSAARVLMSTPRGPNVITANALPGPGDALYLAHSVTIPARSVLTTPVIPIRSRRKINELNVASIVQEVKRR